MSFDCASVYIGIVNAPSEDQYFPQGVIPCGGDPEPLIQISLQDFSALVLDGDQLPAEAPDLAEWDEPLFLLTRTDGQNLWTVRGDVTELPEPSRAFLLAAGIATSALVTAARERSSGSRSGRPAHPRR